MCLEKSFHGCDIRLKYLQDRTCTDVKRGSSPKWTLDMAEVEVSNVMHPCTMQPAIDVFSIPTAPMPARPSSRPPFPRPSPVVLMLRWMLCCIHLPPATRASPPSRHYDKPPPPSRRRGCRQARWRQGRAAGWTRWWVAYGLRGGGGGDGGVAATDARCHEGTPPPQPRFRPPASRPASQPACPTAGPTATPAASTGRALPALLSTTLCSGLSSERLGWGGGLRAAGAHSEAGRPAGQGRQ